MKTILKIDKLAEGRFRCSVDSTGAELSSAIVGLCMSEDDSVLFDTLVDSMVGIVAAWSSRDIDSFSAEFKRACKKLKGELEENNNKNTGLQLIVI